MESRTDKELLDSYVADGDEPAFAELVSRYHPMVYRTCWRLLGNDHDAEDAAQAAFLVLAQKAGSLRQEGRLNGWLHRVARLTALEAVRRRAARERRHAEYALGTDIPVADQSEADMEAVLRQVDTALDGLSVVLREAVVLRYLRGFNEQEAAAQVGCPLGTMKRRASDGIAKLRARLTRRGVTLSGAALAGLLASEASAAVPETLLPSILASVKGLAAATAAGTGATSTAVILAKGAMKAMFIAKVKTVTLTAAACLVVAGSGVVAAKQLSVPSAVKSKPTVAPLVLTETGIESAQATAPKALPVSNAPAPVGGFILRVRKAGDAVAGPRTVRIGDGNDVLRVPDHTVYFSVKVIKILQLPAGAEVAVGDRLLVAVPAENKVWQFTGGECTVDLDRRPTEDGTNPLLNWVYRFPMDAPDAHTADCVAWAELDKQKLASLPAPLVGAAERAAALRQNLDQFELRVVPRLLGGAHGTVILSRQPQPAGRKGIVGETWVEIDATQAGKLIAHLESTDPFLGRAEQTSRGMGKRAWQKGYYLEVSGFEANRDVIYMERLVKVPGEVSRLQALRNQLDGPAAAALDQVLQTLTATP